MISGHQEFLFLAIWGAGYFFPFFSHKLSITFVLHAIFFFRQALAGIFFFLPHPPPQELNGRPLRHGSVGIHVLFHNMFHIFVRKIHQLQNLSEQVCFKPSMPPFVCFRVSLISCSSVPKAISLATRKLLLY